MFTQTNSVAVSDEQWREIVASITRRQFGISVGAATIAALAAACSGSDDAVAGSREGSRTVTHAMGKTVIAGAPSRVVALDSLPIDTVVSLGVSPIGAARAGSADELPQYLGARLDDAKIVGAIAEPNLEAIAALQPDLILSNKQRHGQLYDALSAIAPTVFSASPAVDWQGSVQLFAEALGKQQQASDQLAAFEQRAREVGERIGSAGKAAHTIRVMDTGLRLHGPRTFSGSVLTAAGFTVTGQPWDDKNDMVELSLENIDRIDSDFAFVATTNDAGDLGIPDSLVGQLGASTRGGVHQEDYRVWITGIGLAGANQILDSLDELG